MEPLIIDVRENASGNSSPSSPVVDAIIGGLSKPSGARSLPTLLLYNERGLRLYDDITTKAPEYYLFGCEEQILAEHGDDIVRAMKAAQREDEVVIELGAGALRKTSHLLRALARAAKPVERGEHPKTSYFALDLERRELVRTLDELSTSIGDELAGRVAFGGMWGTYDGGIAFVKRGGLKELHFNQKIANKLDEPDTQRGRSAVHTPVVRTAQPTPTPSESDRASPPQDDGLAAPGLTIATGSTAQTPNRSALPTPPSSLPSPISEELEATPIQLLFLGSSIGNFTPNGAADFLRSLPLRAGSGDTLLLGLDQKNDADLIRLAYDDPQGYTRAFALNGLKNAAEVTGGSIDDNQWSYVEQYNATLGRHEGYYRSKSNQTVRLPTSDAHPAEKTVELQEGELVNFEYSYKYSEKDALALFDAARLRVMRRWQDKQGLYSLWLLERAPFSFPVPTLTRALDIPTTVDGEVPGTSQKLVAPFPSIPTRGEWAEMWKAWDAITLGMIPREMLHQKPIDLRHKCLFYLGHIPAFLDIHLTRLLAGKHTEPEYFKDIFERGIDPHVDDPTQIHPHSEVPVNDEDWPSLEEILGFRDRVRKRLMNLYDDFESGEKPLTRKAGRVIWMTFEHEASHAETLLYMLIQRAGSGTIPPPTTVPDWEALAKVWDAEVSATATAPKVVRIGPAEVKVGHDDFENQDTSAPEGWQSSYEFGWDNEHPRRTVPIGSVDVSTSPITNRDYFDFLSKRSRLGENDIPASWVRLDDKIHVRTLYGPVPYDVAKHWPLAASYDEISAYARAQNGRLPTEPELLAFRDQCDSTVKGEGNIGYRSWHYVPPRPSTREARGHNGGIWEWASTLMHAHDGFVPSSLYPGYSADFHDEQHHVVLGGSFVTIPRVAMRRSYVNFYQHNYPYAWIGGRTCHLGGYFVPPGSVSERALKFEPRIYLPREAYTKLSLRKVVPRHVTKTGFLDDFEILMSWTDVVLSVVFVFSAVYILKLSDGLRLPATWRLKILQDSRLSAVSLPPRPSFGHRKHAPTVSRTSYAATAFTRDRALRSFSRYEALARNELGAKRRNLNNLRGRHARIAAEIGYEGKLDRFRAAIDINNKVAGATVRCSMLQDENASAVLQSWTDDGPTDLSRVTEALKHCIRDWSLSGQEERARVFRPILDVLNQVPIDQRKSTKVLVPGAGLCRLGWEIARMGFDVTANEVSSYMTLPFQMLLDGGATAAPNCHTVCPHFSWFSHTRSNDSLFQTATFPDIVPRVGPDGTISSSLEAENMLGEELGDFYAPGGKFQLIDSDFLSLSSPNRTDPASHSVEIQTSHLPLVPIQPHDRGYDFIVTLFFIDTAHNILAYLDQIHALLRGRREHSAAGTWINLGPLLWPTGASLEASLEEVLAMSKRVGLDVVGETESDQAINSIETRRTLECQYTANRAGMMKWMYQAEFWVARRRED